MSDREFINPYPGTAPFQDRREDRLIFFGRSREVTRLADLILSEPHVLLFARSGLGKSSLINAGLLEGLRVSDCFPVVARVTHNLEGGPIISIFDRIDEESKKLGVVFEGEQDRSSLWTFFEGTRFLSSDGRPLKAVLILDQFEELFARLPPEWRTNFIDQLADLARGRVPRSIRKDAIDKLDKLHDEEERTPPANSSPDRQGNAAGPAPAVQDPQRERLLALAYGGIDLDVKIVISIREDFLAELESLKDRMPLLFRTTMRLEPLSRNQAEEAIVKPSQQKEILGDETIEIEPAAVKAMLDFLSGQQTDARSLKDDDIEPVQLQVLCHSLFDRVRASDRSAIAVQDLGGHLGMARILRGYYNSVVRRLPVLRGGWNPRKFRVSLANLLVFNLPRYAVRSLCEDGLILPAGYRNSLEGGYIGGVYGVPERDLTELVEQRLLRSEPRKHGRFYELSHDSLVDVLRKNRKRRRLITAGLAVLLVGGAILARDSAEQLWTDIRVIPLRHAIVAPVNEDQRRRDIVKYGEISSKIDLSNYTLNDLVFNESDVARPLETVKFSGSKLNHCTFILGSKLDFAQLFSMARRSSDFYRYLFNGATTIIDDTTFDGSTIFLGNFTDAQITRTKFRSTKLTAVFFRQAKLTDVDFSEATFSSPVDFEGATFLGLVNFAKADVRGADFTGVHLDGRIDFTEAEWWLVKGWNDKQREQFKRDFPPGNFAQSDRYSKEVKDRTNKVQTARTDGTKPGKEKDRADKELALTLNALAWYRAIRGAELQKAQLEIDQALKLSTDSQSLDTKQFLDTKAYILMQLGHFDEAKLLLAQALGADPANQVLPDLKNQDTGIIYRYALSLEFTGDAATAKTVYSMTRYEPTHERVLLSKPAGPKQQ